MGKAEEREKATKMFVSLGVSEKAAVNLYKRGLFLPSHVADVSDVLLRECGVPASKLEKFRNSAVGDSSEKGDEKKKMNELFKKNMPYKEEVYFNDLMSKALTNYTWQWDAPINNYLRTGDSYWETQIFKTYMTRYGNTKELDLVYLPRRPGDKRKKMILFFHVPSAGIR